MSNESRINVSLFFAVLSVPLIFLLINALTGGGIGITMAMGSVRQMFWLLFLLVVAVIPMLPLLTLYHALLQHFSMCYLSLYLLGMASLYATAMWPALGLLVIFPAAGACAGLIFYFAGVFPNSGDGPKLADRNTWLLSALAWAMTGTALVYCYAKLQLLQVRLQHSDVLAIAVKPSWDLTSYAHWTQHGSGELLLLVGKKTYPGQMYFQFITGIGWWMCLILTLGTWLAYFLYNKRLKTHTGSEIV